jgi:hypothetical protein
LFPFRVRMRGATAGASRVCLFLRGCLRLLFSVEEVTRQWQRGGMTDRGQKDGAVVQNRP